MQTENLAYLGSDPGAVKFGNFINYYSFHTAKQRIDNLNLQMFPQLIDKKVLCLDIGCNTGELSNEIYSYLRNNIYPNHDIHMLAVDIDPILIQRAQESNKDTEVTFSAVNIVEKTDCEKITKYLESHKKETFDLVFCFSVTMWIHLNAGDSGLLDFLRYIKDISNTIIIEPQPWNCYRNAQRRMKKSGSNFPLYESLEIRSDVVNKIENFLTDGSHKKVYESPISSWKRIVQSYQIQCL